MDISSVTKSATQAIQALKRSEDSPSPTPKTKEPEGKPSPEAAPKPVINPQGQTTGRILNVSA